MQSEPADFQGSAGSLLSWGSVTSMYDLDSVETGKRYHVEGSDCCLGFRFTAMLTGKDGNRLVFDNGVEITSWAGTTIEPEVVEAEVVPASPET